MNQNSAICILNASFFLLHAVQRYVSQRSVTTIDEKMQDVGAADLFQKISRAIGNTADFECPLPMGCLSQNLGVPVIVVCTRVSNELDFEIIYGLLISSLMRRIS